MSIRFEVLREKMIVFQIVWLNKEVADLHIRKQVMVDTDCKMKVVV